MTTERDLPQKVDAPSRSHGQAQLYAEAIVRTIRQPLIVLSGGFVVEANPAFYRTFQVGPEETEGRPIQELGNGQWNIPALRDMLENVLPNSGNVEDFRVEHDFEQLGRRVMLLNAHRMEGADRPGRVLLAIEDITERERSRFELEAQKEFAEKVVDASRDALLILGSGSAGEVGQRDLLHQVSGRSWRGRGAPRLRARQWSVGYSPPARAPRETAPGERYIRRLRNRARFRADRSPRDAAERTQDRPHAAYLCLAIEDITERKRTEVERELLTRELSHRVKNVFAVIQALATQTKGRTNSVDAFREAFLGRLHALARAHSMLLDADWRGTELDALVENAVEAYRVDNPEIVEVEGEPVPLTPQQSLGLSLVLHELGTNAAKYGALSHRDGHLRVFWRKEKDREHARVRLCWEERGGPQVAPPTEKGFGSRLIEQACTHQLNGSVELDYAPGGFICRIVFPMG